MRFLNSCENIALDQLVYQYDRGEFYGMLAVLALLRDSSSSYSNRNQPSIGNASSISSSLLSYRHCSY
eukprot:9481530-Pyramimonas_sp.AAC.3